MKLVNLGMARYGADPIADTPPPPTYTPPKPPRAWEPKKLTFTIAAVPSVMTAPPPPTTGAPVVVPAAPIVEPDAPVVTPSAPTTPPGGVMVTPTDPTVPVPPFVEVAPPRRPWGLILGVGALLGVGLIALVASRR